MRLIDADALDNVIQSLNEKNWGITRVDYKTIDAVLFEFPTVEERKTGRWIDMDDHVMCSCCGATHYGADKNYCPNCGSYNGGENG